LIVAAETSTREFVDSVLRQAGYATARALEQVPTIDRGRIA
jgi:hypothetical protein